MDYEEYKRKALEPIVNYIESVMASYSKEELEARIKKALPEKESEDERIRKAIIELIKQSSNLLCPQNQDKMLAYLGKQKEQHSVEWSAYDKATIEYIIEDIKELRDEETNEEVIETYDRELNLLQCINDSVKLCNYTKPAEWSEEDEKIIDEICGNLEYILHNTICAEQTKVNL